MTKHLYWLAECGVPHSVRRLLTTSGPFRFFPARVDTISKKKEINTLGHIVKIDARMILVIQPSMSTPSGQPRSLTSAPSNRTARGYQSSQNKTVTSLHGVTCQASRSGYGHGTATPHNHIPSCTLMDGEQTEEKYG
ncbi:hypothetical protein EDD15DRAFT_2202959 [Pisolithus albus]|nr:hypothetical protein EDD15DRAFT_2202959 [Pisolithus albus]